jgi:hypothetical protein
LFSIGRGPDGEFRAAPVAFSALPRRQARLAGLPSQSMPSRAWLEKRLRARLGPQTLFRARSANAASYGSV